MNVRAIIYGTVLIITGSVLSMRCSGQRPKAMMVSINMCGYEFSLGMARTSSLEHATRGMCKPFQIGNVASKDDVAFFLKAADDPSVSYGMLEFRHDRLVQVAKNWDLNIRSPQQYSDVLFNLFKRLKQQGIETCSVSVDDRLEPDTVLKQTTFICGAKKVKLTGFDYRNEHGFQVQEILE